MRENSPVLQDGLKQHAQSSLRELQASSLIQIQSLVALKFFHARFPTSAASQTRMSEPVRSGEQASSRLQRSEWNGIAGKISQRRFWALFKKCQRKNTVKEKASTAVEKIRSEFFLYTFPMSYNDEPAPSSSSAEYFESPHEARKRELKRQLEKKGQKQAADKQGASLQDLKLALLKGEVQEQDEQKTDDDGARDRASSMTTKTREDEIKEEKMDADTKADTDQIAKQSNAQKQTEHEQMRQEIQSDQA